MIEKIRKNRNKAIAFGVSIVVFIIVIVMIILSVNGTFASSISDYRCANDGWSVTASGGKYYCCPSGYTLNSYGKCYKDVSSSSCPYTYGNPFPSSGSGGDDLYCYTPSQDAILKTYSCYYCAATGDYVWTYDTKTQASCYSTWTKKSDITSSSDCKAPTYSCYYCASTNTYSWAADPRPEASCASTWTKKSDITSVANCTAPVTYYTVSFNLNGGSGSIANQTVQSGRTASKPSTNPTRAGYTFSYWATSSGSEYNFSSAVTGNLTLYAHWTENSSGGGGTIDPTPTRYTVKFDLNGGSGSIANQTVESGKSASRPSTNPTRAGYTFSYWSTSKSGSEYNFSSAVTGNLTLYAQWTENSFGGGGTTDPTPTRYTVKFDLNGGSGSIANQTVQAGQTANRPSINPTKDKMAFNGWATAVTCEKDEMYDFSTKVTKDITLYACYKDVDSNAEDNNSNIDDSVENPKTGNILIGIAWIVGVGALGYTVYYFRKRKTI